jgi:hypothetical protein
MMSLRQFDRRHAWLLCCLVLQLQWVSGAADAASSDCDPGLKPSGGNELGYVDRGDRCEGLYAQEVSGGALEIASITTNFANYKFAPAVPLRLEWPALGAAEVSVRSSGLRRKLYYRMDARRPANPPVYSWSPDILARLDLSRDEIGLLAWTQHTLAGVTRRVYLPLKVTAQAAAVEPPGGEQQGHLEAYRIVLVSTVELQEVYVTLRTVERDGRLGKSIRSNSGLDHGFYPADRPITFRIPFSELPRTSTGLFSLSVGAEVKNGEPRIAPEIIFFHSSAKKKAPAGTGGQP